MTHDELRRLAVRWLTNTQKCTVVLSELVTSAFETPDAIGWKFGASTLVECKISRPDFLRNQHKPSIRSGRSVGRQRYFLTPEGMISPDDLTGANEGYGLLWVNSANRVKVAKEAPRVETSEIQEIRMLTSALRRIKTREFLTIVSREEAVND